MRKFEDKEANREQTPLLIGIVGPSGTGKTYSALRLATGIQRVCPGPIFGIDTEAGRMLHYAGPGKFQFRRVAFGAPFSPLDYLAAVEHCVAKGARTIIVDSFSHEHEGVGGVLEMHTEEHKRLGGSEKTKLLAWNKPKQARRRFINSIMQMSVNLIFCFRAKEKLKIERGKDPVPMGWMCIGAEEMLYEQTANLLLLPGANGRPTLRSDMLGEQAMIKIPEQFAGMFNERTQLGEDVGEQMARWAAGGAPPAQASPAEMIASYASCSESTALRSLEEQRKASWSKFSKEEKVAVKQAAEDATERIRLATRFTEDDTPAADVESGEEAA